MKFTIIKIINVLKSTVFFAGSPSLQTDPLPPPPPPPTGPPGLPIDNWIVILIALGIFLGLYITTKNINKERVQ